MEKKIKQPLSLNIFTLSDKKLSICYFICLFLVISFVSYWIGYTTGYSLLREARENIFLELIFYLKIQNELFCFDVAEYLLTIKSHIQVDNIKHIINQRWYEFMCDCIKELVNDYNELLKKRK